MPPCIPTWCASRRHPPSQTAYGAFDDTRLELHLRGRGIDTIMITRIETNVCCKTTARKAMVRDFRVCFLSDATITGGVRGLARADIQRVSLARWAPVSRRC